MLHWYIAMADREARLEEIDIPAIREITDPIRDHIAARLRPIAGEDDLTIIFMVEDDRRLSIRLKGEPIIVNRARDILGNEEVIGALLT